MQILQNFGEILGFLQVFFAARIERHSRKACKRDYYSSLPLVPRGRRRSLGGLENLFGKFAPPVEKVQWKTDRCSFEKSDTENLKSLENSIRLS